MKLVLLGTTGYHPNRRRQTACFALPELGLVLDAGTGFFNFREHLCTPSIDVYLSHAHLDHVIGLSFLFDILHERQVDRVTVHGEREKLAAIEEQMLAPLLFPAKLPCEFKPLNGAAELPGGGRLTYFHLKHPGGSLGYRLDWPHFSLAYVTDTTAAPNADYIPHLRGVDLLLHECNFPDGHEALAELTGHSCITPVAQVAKAAGVKRLVLVHLNPIDASEDPVGVKTAQAIFPACELGYDGMEIEF